MYELSLNDFRKLTAYMPRDTKIMIRDGFNGGGVPRDINSGPCVHTITESDADETADCEGRVGEKVIVIGFGSY